MSRDIELFIKNYLNEINENNAAIFAGAGLSAAVGYVNWKELLRPLAEEIELDIDLEHDLVSVAQYHLNDNGRHKINQQLINEIATNRGPSENHTILSRLPISTYWTTNYDKLIERSLEDFGKVVDVKYTNIHLATTKSKRDAVVYKMHGDIDHPDSAVLTKDDYERYVIDHGPYVNALSGDLISKTFLFLGFSFTDPNLDYIMSRVRIHFKEHQRQHYCIFKKCSKTDFEDLASFQHAQIKQRLVINDLKRFQIKTLLVDEYTDITEILARIEKNYRQKSIFLSGSAHDYGHWQRSDVENFLCKLGETLVQKGYKISSGIGLGIGNAFITGAINAVYGLHKAQVSEYLTMRPFPQHIDDLGKRKETWKKYRYEIIGTAGIALFFIGNKHVDGQVVLADGMLEEFQIAHELGLSIIPIGCSGFMAQELWNKVIEDVSSYYEDPSEKLTDALKELGVPVEKPEQLISKIIDTIDIVIKE
ncbi:SIR2 family protein [Vibrio sp. Of7-15]|uniref:SIR2 family protein n=1 Tax=Vibrio sp. Of7-15 TaxID=2724879 RepID=UPI001EF229CF|nr:SIR2 family protein [Vibrio sp. Of7-15]MCG7497488.1 SIR2 family protein [Vibrio sp. Of7-15]